jgi:indolepyruvate ferredoxin oxidoreductase beta subunit
MGDGRYDSARLMRAVEAQSRAVLLLDMETLARGSGAMINAVMLGAIAGAGALPIPVTILESAIRADGKSVETNLRGFRAGLKAALDARRARREQPQPSENVAVSAGVARSAAQDAGGHAAVGTALAELEREVEQIPAVARDIVREGVRRLASYQGRGYARRYLDRLAPIGTADERARAGGRLLRETARHLAVRMSYEDVIRVAQAKIDPRRMARIAAEVGVQAGELLTVTEFLKPGIEEFCSILPPLLARPILALAQRRGWRGHWGMEVNSASVSGFLRFWLLAKLRRWRPRSFRFAEEQREIERWLALIVAAAASSAELALEVAECARLIKGYGDTLQRGTANYRKIETQVIEPALAGAIPALRAVDAIASARTAALLDPEGEGLARCLSAIALQSAHRVAAE